MGIRLCTRIFLALALSPALLLPFEQVVWASEATATLSKVRPSKQVLLNRSPHRFSVPTRSKNRASFGSSLLSRPLPGYPCWLMVKVRCRLMPTTFMGHGMLLSILVQEVRRLL